MRISTYNLYEKKKNKNYIYEKLYEIVIKTNSFDLYWNTITLLIYLLINSKYFQENLYTL